jgi:hypothetical protein
MTGVNAAPSLWSMISFLSIAGRKVNYLAVGKLGKLDKVSWCVRVHEKQTMMEILHNARLCCR